MATATSLSAVTFPTAAPQSFIDSSRSVTHYTGWRTESGSDDLITLDAVDAAFTDEGQMLRVPAGGIVLTVPEIAYNTSGTEIGRISADMAERGVRGYILGGIWWQAHYGNPGTNRTSNALTELGRVQIAASGYTVAQ